MVQMGVLKSAAAQRALFAIERYLLKRARHVVVVTESFRECVVGKGVPRERIDVIPNGVDAGRYYRDPDAAAPLPDLERRNGELIAGYLGNFGAGQGLRTVLDDAARLRHRAPHVRFVLVGDGTEKAEVVERWRELRLDNVSIHPPIPKEQTRAFYNACDLNVVPLAPIPIFAETIPSKIFEVMACQRPVLRATLAQRYLDILERVAGRTPVLDAEPSEIREAAQPV